MINTTETISIRHERHVPGSPENLGHDTDLFGLFFESTASFRTVSFNAAVSALMEVGMDLANAEKIVRLVAADDKAFDVSNGFATDLSVALA
jgi:hypothetical protein